MEIIENNNNQKEVTFMDLFILMFGCGLAALGWYGFSGEIHKSDLNKQELCLSKPNCSKIYKSLLVGNENTTWNYQKLAHKYAVYNLMQINYDKQDDNFTKEEINQITSPLTKKD